MAKKIVNECCDCATEAYPCRGSACPNRTVAHYYCDKCKKEFDAIELYVTDDGDLCEYCLLNKYETVAQLEERERA